jgi:hypothetical protein
MIDLRKDGKSIENNSYKVKGKIDLRKELDASDFYNIPQTRTCEYYQPGKITRTYEYYQPGKIKNKPKEIYTPDIFTYDLVADPGFNCRIGNRYKPKEVSRCIYKMSKYDYLSEADYDIHKRNKIFDKFSECDVMFDHVSGYYIIKGIIKEDENQHTLIRKENGELFLKHNDRFILQY